MRRVIFDYIEDANGIVWPDAVGEFDNAKTIIDDGVKKIIADYYGSDNTIPSYVTDVDVYYHMGLTGGDGMEPIGILNDNTMAIGVTITARVSEDPASPIFDLVNGKPWRVAMRDSLGDIYDIIKINFDNAGAASFTYKTDGPAAIVGIDEKDLTVVLDGVELRGHIVGDNEFKVYREV